MKGLRVCSVMRQSWLHEKISSPARTADVYIAPIYAWVGFVWIHFSLPVGIIYKSVLCSNKRDLSRIIIIIIQ